MICKNCIHNGGFGTGTNVNCFLYGLHDNEGKYCAGKELTIPGWVELAITAEALGDMERGKLYRQRIIDLRKQKKAA